MPLPFFGDLTALIIQLVEKQIWRVRYDICKWIVDLVSGRFFRLLYLLKRFILVISFSTMWRKNIHSLPVISWDKRRGFYSKTRSRQQYRCPVFLWYQSWPIMVSTKTISKFQTYSSICNCLKDVFKRETSINIRSIIKI